MTFFLIYLRACSSSICSLTGATVNILDFTSCLLFFLLDPDFGKVRTCSGGNVSSLLSVTLQPYDNVTVEVLVISRVVLFDKLLAIGSWQESVSHLLPPKSRLIKNTGVVRVYSSNIKIFLDVNWIKSFANQFWNIIKADWLAWIIYHKTAECFIVEVFKWYKDTTI